MTDPFTDQVGGDHYKSFAFDPFKVCANWPKWAGDVFKYLIRNKGDDDYEKAMHTFAMWMDMDSAPLAQPLAAEVTRQWVEMSYDALDPRVVDVVIALSEYVSSPTAMNLQGLMEAFYELQESTRSQLPVGQWKRCLAYLDSCLKKLKAITDL